MQFTLAGRTAAAWRDGDLKVRPSRADKNLREGTPTVKIEPLAPTGSAPPPGAGAAVGGPSGISPSHPARQAPLPRAVAAEDAVMSALRQQLPRQGNPMGLLASIAWVNNTAEGRATALPAATRAAIEALWQAVTPVDELAAPEGLLQATLASGPGLERLLAFATPEALATALLQDWKALLLRLKASVQIRAPRSGSGAASDAPLPGRPGALTALRPEATSPAVLDDPAMLQAELWSQASAVIARVTCHQLANLHGGTPLLALVFEVPLRQGNDATVLRLRAEQQPATPYLGQERWSMEFAVQLPDRGALQGRVRLAGNRIDATIQAEDAVLLTALRDSEADLRRGLEGLGLAIERLDWRSTSSLDTSGTGSWLVDIRA